MSSVTTCGHCSARLMSKMNFCGQCRHPVTSDTSIDGNVSETCHLTNPSVVSSSDHTARQVAQAADKKGFIGLQSGLIMLACLPLLVGIIYIVWPREPTTQEQLCNLKVQTLEELREEKQRVLAETLSAVKTCQIDCKTELRALHDKTESIQEMLSEKQQLLTQTLADSQRCQYDKDKESQSLIHKMEELEKCHQENVMGSQTLKYEIETKEQNMNKKMTELQRCQYEKDKEVQSLKFKIETLQRMNNGKVIELQSCTLGKEKEIQKLQYKIKDVEASRDDKFAEVQTLQEKMKEVPNLTLEMKAENGFLQEKINALNSKIIYHNKHIDQLEAEIKSKENGFRREKETLQEDIDRRTKEIQECKNSLLQMKAANGEENINALNSKILYHNKHIDQLEAEIKCKEDGFRHEKETLQEDIDRRTKEIQELNNTCLQMKAENGLLQEKIKALNSKLLYHNKHIDQPEIKNKDDSFGNKKKNLEEEIGQIFQTMKKLTNTKLQEKITALINVIKNDDKQVTQLEAEIESKEHKKNNLKEYIDENMNAIQELIDAEPQTLSIEDIIFTTFMYTFIAITLWIIGTLFLGR